jgi:hypothetical protein
MTIYILLSVLRIFGCILNQICSKLEYLGIQNMWDYLDRHIYFGDMLIRTTVNPRSNGPDKKDFEYKAKNLAVYNCEFLEMLGL